MLINEDTNMFRENSRSEVNNMTIMVYYISYYIGLSYLSFKCLIYLPLLCQTNINYPSHFFYLIFLYLMKFSKNTVHNT